MMPTALPELWRTRAEELRRYGADPQAITLEAAAAELEATLRATADTELTLAEAAAESGYSERRLRELLSAGEIPQAGRKGRPRIRRSDLPRRAGAGKPALGLYDAAADAAQLLAQGVGR
jgi:hypothetical protein